MVVDGVARLFPERAATEPYASIEDVVLRHGRFFDPSPVALPHGEPRRCFGTCAADAMTSRRVFYAEGFAGGGVLPATHHAMVVGADGLAIDRTWIWTAARTRHGVVGGRPVMPLGSFAFLAIVVPTDVVRLAWRATVSASLLAAWEDGYPLLREPYSPGVARRIYRRMLAERATTTP